MTRDEACKEALAICVAQGLDAGQVVTAYARGGGALSFIRSLFSKGKAGKSWIVITHMHRKGGNRVFEFDAETGELIKESLIAR